MRLFWSLSRINFWIVLTVVALGVFEAFYFDGARTTFMGCRPNVLGLSCAEGPLKGVKEVLLNLPILFVVALVFLPLEGWRAVPLAVLLWFLLDLIVLLALVHVGQTIVGLVKVWRVRGRAQ
jgi:hypothetical protein